MLAQYRKSIISLLLSGIFVFTLFGFHRAEKNEGAIEIGIARVDITPEYPVRLTGYGNRTTVFDSITQPLWGKVLVLSQKGEQPVVWITLDLVGFPGYFADDLFNRISKKLGLKERSQLVVSATHTHNGPETGVLLNIFGTTLPPEQLADVIIYRNQLLNKLEQLLTDAYQSKKEARLSWALGSASFAMNRRVIENGKWKNFGETPNGPVDHDLPVLRATDQQGKTIALLLSYACHGTTLLPQHNFVHGDWMGATQQMLEEKYPGATAMVALGCAGDANPSPRGDFKNVHQHAEMITDEITRMISADKLVTLNSIPVTKMKRVELSFVHVPDARELVELSKQDAAPGLYARNSLTLMANGGTISNSMSYPVQVWSFGKQLAMVFLGGEVVVDYSLRIKREFSKDKLWVNAYSNDVSTYIASKRLFAEGGYEVDGSMPYYNRPSRLTEDTEDRIMKAIHELVPSGFNK